MHIVYSEIYNRIKKHRGIKGYSQEHFADLVSMSGILLTQGEVSRMENNKANAKKDLELFEAIANVLDIPIDYLLFGSDIGPVEPPHYKYKYKRDYLVSDVKSEDNHLDIIADVMGMPKDDLNTYVYQFSEYKVYFVIDIRITREKESDDERELELINTFIFHNDEVVATMRCYYHDLDVFADKNDFNMLYELLPIHKLDYNHVWQRLNPYSLLYQFTDEDRKEAVASECQKRINELRQYNEEAVVYITDVEIISEYRNKGLIHLYMDCIRKYFGDSLIWLNMKIPTIDPKINRNGIALLDRDEIASLYINMGIAQKLGFSIDNYHKIICTIYDEENDTSEVYNVPYEAFYIPGYIKKIIDSDGSLYEDTLAKADYKIKEDQDLYNVEYAEDEVNDIAVAELVYTGISGNAIGDKKSYYAVLNRRSNEVRFGIANESMVAEPYHTDKANDESEYKNFSEIADINAAIKIAFVADRLGLDPEQYGFKDYLEVSRRYIDTMLEDTFHEANSKIDYIEHIVLKDDNGEDIDCINLKLEFFDRAYPDDLIWGSIIRLADRSMVYSISSENYVKFYHNKQPDKWKNSVIETFDHMPKADESSYESIFKELYEYSIKYNIF